MTDGPDPARVAAYLARMQDMILKHGWMVQGVFPREGDEGVAFGYTVGLTVAGLPELIISGNLGPENTQHLLNSAALKHLECDGFKPGSEVKGILIDDIALRVRETAERPPLGFAYQMYGRKPTALQLVWPDERGNYPGDEGYELEGHQELF